MARTTTMKSAPKARPQPKAMKKAPQNKKPTAMKTVMKAAPVKATAMKTVMKKAPVKTTKTVRKAASEPSTAMKAKVAAKPKMLNRKDPSPPVMKAKVAKTATTAMKSGKKDTKPQTAMKTAPKATTTTVMKRVPKAGLPVYEGIEPELLVSDEVEFTTMEADTSAAGDAKQDAVDAEQGGSAEQAEPEKMEAGGNDDKKDEEARESRRTRWLNFAAEHEGRTDGKDLAAIAPAVAAVGEERKEGGSTIEVAPEASGSTAAGEREKEEKEAEQVEEPAPATIESPEESDVVERDTAADDTADVVMEDAVECVDEWLLIDNVVKKPEAGDDNEIEWTESSVASDDDDGDAPLAEVAKAGVDEVRVPQDDAKVANDVASDAKDVVMSEASAAEEKQVTATQEVSAPAGAPVAEETTPAAADEVAERSAEEAEETAELESKQDTPAMDVASAMDVSTASPSPATEDVGEEPSPVNDDMSIDTSATANGNNDAAPLIGNNGLRHEDNDVDQASGAKTATGSLNVEDLYHKVVQFFPQHQGQSSDERMSGVAGDSECDARLEKL